jgi:hypothetical protein
VEILVRERDVDYKHCIIFKDQLGEGLSLEAYTEVFTGEARRGIVWWNIGVW